MILNEINDLKFYTFENIQKTNLVSHCFTTKFGGVSKGYCKSMNLSFKNDLKDNVMQNYKIICDAINCNFENVVLSNQVHKDKVYKVTKKDAGKGLLKESDIKEYDALITNQQGIVLTTFYADCVPIFILDTEKKAIGIAHSGWKGTVLEIGKKTILKMIKEFNTNPKDLIIGIGPSISLCCFQVDKPVVDSFLKNIPFSKKYIFQDNSFQNKFKIDLQNIIKESIISLGVLEKNIEISGLCTMCNSHMFFSHRIMGDKRGSLAGLICLH